MLAKLKHRIRLLMHYLFLFAVFQSSHKYIATALCPDLKQLDGNKTDALRKVVDDMIESITLHVSKNLSLCDSLKDN
jgi:hypothetical protein